MAPEKHARRNNLPLVFIEIKREKRGFYTLYLTELIHNPSEYAEGEITRKYAKKVEEIIRRDPPNWLWSHHRWKHTPLCPSVKIAESVDISEPALHSAS